MNSDEPAFRVDPEFDTFNEADIEELIGEASSELQLLLKGASLSIKQVLREMTRVLSESADLLLLISSEFLESANLLLDNLLSLDDASLMTMPLLVG
jgi:predicted rRNA methylase YqxC with S4 and FtsJ domains